MQAVLAKKLIRVPFGKRINTSTSNLNRKFFVVLIKIPKNLTSLIACIINKFSEKDAFLHHSGNYKVYFQLTFKLGVLV